MSVGALHPKKSSSIFADSESYEQCGDFGTWVGRWSRWIGDVTILSYIFHANVVITGKPSYIYIVTEIALESRDPLDLIKIFYKDQALANGCVLDRGVRIISVVVYTWWRQIKEHSQDPAMTTTFPPGSRARPGLLPLPLLPAPSSSHPQPGLCPLPPPRSMSIYCWWFGPRMI